MSNKSIKQFNCSEQINEQKLHYNILQGSEGQGGKNALICDQPYETLMC